MCLLEGCLVTPEQLRSAAQSLVQRSTRVQRLPLVVEDEWTLQRVAALLESRRQQRAAVA